jgi:tight adherence protein B
MAKKEIIINFIIIQILMFIVGKLFYGTILAGIALGPLSVVILKERKKQITLKNKNKLEKQFKDMLISVSDGLKTGYALENAIKESYKDMRSVYGEKSNICVELRMLISRINLNVGCEKAVNEFAERLDLKNARTFAQMVMVAKRTGGNLSEIIKNVTEDIVLKEETREEINAAVSEKRNEQRIMTVIPLLIIIYVTVSSPGFFDVMYESVMGKLIMTFCIVLYITAYVWGERIVNTIEEGGR